MFRGAAAVNLDAKGRVAIPTRYRAEIMEKNQGQMVCTVDIRQPCLLLYPLDGYATECEMDAQGRILLSGPLRQHAKLEKGLMLVGQLNKFEIWSDTEWYAQIDEDIEIGSSAEFGASEELKMLSL
ncbi:MAG: division/cell wall cluster transcriptional repressor MraZ [Haemophilus parainfluenzae]|nr:division/cell wall cluster transcriptional repressor MraZ [Haemophilus parainfluenzae]